MNGLQITNILFDTTVKPTKIVIILNDAFVVRGIRVIKGKSGHIVGWPRSYDMKRQEGVDTAGPLSQEFRKYAETEIVNAFNRLQSENKSTVDLAGD